MSEQETPEELDPDFQYISMMIERKDVPSIIGHAAVSLVRIARAQEKLVELAEADVTAQVHEAADALAQDKAKEIVEQKTKRSFIGGK